MWLSAVWRIRIAIGPLASAGALRPPAAASHHSHRACPPTRPQEPHQPWKPKKWTALSLRTSTCLHDRPSVTETTPTPAAMSRAACSTFRCYVTSADCRLRHSTNVCGSHRLETHASCSVFGSQRDTFQTKTVVHQRMVFARGHAAARVSKHLKTEHCSPRLR